MGAIIPPPTVDQLFRSNALLLPKLRAAMGGVGATGPSARNGLMAIIADSIGLGYGSTGTNNTMRYNGWVQRLCDMMNVAGINCENNGWIGMGGNNGGGTNTDTYDSRIAVGSGWVRQPGFFGGNAIAASSATTDLSLLPLNNVNTFVIYYFRFSGGGSFKYNINGGSDTTQSVGGGNSVQSITVSAAAVASNQLNINWVSGQIYMLGVDAYDSNNKVIRILNGGWVGSTSGEWAGATAAFGAAPYVMGQDVTGICLGVNDADQGVSLSTYIANMQTVISNAQAQGDVFLIVQSPVNPAVGASVATQQAYANAQLSLAAQYNIPYINIMARWQSYAISQPYGNYFDDYHPSGLGAKDYAQAVFTGIST